MITDGLEMRDSANVFGSFLSSVQGVGERSAKRVIDSATGAFSNLGGFQGSSIPMPQSGRGNSISNVLRIIASSDAPVTIASLMKSTALSVDAVIPILKDAQEAGLLTSVQLADQSRSYELTSEGKAVISISDYPSP